MDRTSAVQSNSKPIGDANVSTPQHQSINKQIKSNQDKSYYELGIESKTLSMTLFQIELLRYLTIYCML